MNTFKDFANCVVLQEMPYIFDIPLDRENSNGYLDLEWENLGKGNIEGLKKQLYSIFNGKHYIDKYGNFIKLQSPLQKKKFAQAMLASEMLVGQARMVFGLDLDRLKGFIYDILNKSIFNSQLGESNLAARGAFGPLTTGEHGGQVGNNDWYAPNDARNLFGSGGKRKKKKKKSILMPLQRRKPFKEGADIINVDGQLCDYRDDETVTFAIKGGLIFFVDNSKNSPENNTHMDLRNNLRFWVDDARDENGKFNTKKYKELLKKNRNINTIYNPTIIDKSLSIEGRAWKDLGKISFWEYKNEVKKALPLIEEMLAFYGLDIRNFEFQFGNMRAYEFVTYSTVIGNSDIKGSKSPEEIEREKQLHIKAGMKRLEGKPIIGGSLKLANQLKDKTPAEYKWRTTSSESVSFEDAYDII